MNMLGNLLMLVLVSWRSIYIQAATCGAPVSRSNFMVRTVVNPLIATQLSTVTAATQLQCQLSCLADDTCEYITFALSTRQCSLYAKGTTSYNVTGKDVYTMETKTAKYKEEACYPCVSNPCLNQATCSNVFLPAKSYQCTCQPGYSGIRCQNITDNCVSAPCKNGANCANGVNVFSCNCTAGYEGHTCDQVKDNCKSAPCQNGATCNNGVNTYNCSCAAGYTGVLCDVVINNCASFPCVNGATCTNAVNSYTCGCVAGYTGTICQTIINNCATSPCQNGGTCTNGINTYTCACVAGYTGSQCQTVIDNCASAPCQNNGTCNNAVNSYTCTCVTGWTGTQCNTFINYCLSSPCMNGGTCSPALNLYVCACADGFNGSQCQNASGNFIAFYASLLQSAAISPANPLVYSQVLNYGGGFDSVNMNSFTCPQAGVYWFFLTSVFYATPTIMSIAGMTSTYPMPKVFRLHSTYSGFDTMSRDFMRTMTQNQKVSVTSTYIMHSDGSTIGPSWGGFRVDNIMWPQIIFEVICTTASFTTAFDTVVLNIGGGWVSATDTFVAPQAGIYYLSYSYGSPADVGTQRIVTIGGAHSCDNSVFDSSKTGNDVGSRGCLAYLASGSNVKVIFITGSGVSSMGESTFRGFLYSPVQGTPVAWSVHIDGTILSGAVSGVAYFSNIYVNTGPTSPWQSSTYTVVVPVTGTYYMEIVTEIYNGPRCDMNIVLNGNVVLARIYATYAIRFITRSRSIITYLRQGDQVQVIWGPSTSYTGVGYAGVSFMGVLLYQH